MPQEYGIRGFPTIKVFVPGKAPVDYQGARDAKHLAEFALQQVHSTSFPSIESMKQFSVALYHQ